MPDNTSTPDPDLEAAGDADLGDEGSLLVEDQAFAIVGEWIITAEISDAAFRVYSMLLRFGGTSGCRMPSRALLGRRLHRSVDSIDRALRELPSAGIVRIEHRHDGRQYRSNRYHLRTSKPHVGGEGGRRRAALPRGSTQRTPPPPPGSPAARATAEADLLAACGIEDLERLSARCAEVRTDLGQPPGRWAPQCLAVAIKLAVIARGWPAPDVVPALLAVAADPATRSPARLAEAGPWWDAVSAAAPAGTDDDITDLEARLTELGGHRPALQAQARAELAREGLPVSRVTVARRAVAILDRVQVPT